MARLDAEDARYEALFASLLQQTDSVSPEAIAEAIDTAIRLFGAEGCASRMAQEFGDHPEMACARMQWARRLLDELSS